MNKFIRSIVMMSCFVGIGLPAARAEEHRLALLVQVSEFKNNGNMSKLKAQGETQIDAREMQAVLKLPRYNFTSTILEQRDATHDGILRALDKLAQDAQAGDAVVFYFSGHGANSKKQFTLCPYDVSVENPANDVTETDIRHWVDKLWAKQVTNITIILDSCFSLPGARGGSFVAREKLMLRTDELQSEQIGLNLAPDQVVVLAAAGQNGTAYEGVMNPNPKASSELEGVYTAFLCDQLKNANPETTFRQLSERATSGVTECINRLQTNNPKKYPHPQTPGIFGNEALARRPLFSSVNSPVIVHPVEPPGNVTPTKQDPPVNPTPVTKQDPPVNPTPALKPETLAYAEVVKIESNQVTIDRGAGAGVKVGDVYDLYPTGEQQFTSRQRKEGAFRVDRVEADQASGALLEGSQASLIAQKNRAIQTAQRLDLSLNTEIIVQLEGTDRFKSMMQTELAQFPFIKTEGRPQIILRGQETVDGKLEATVYGSDGNAQYANTAFNGGKALYHADNAVSLREQLSPFLGQLITMQALLQQTNPNPAFNITLTTGQPSYTIARDTGDFTFKTEKEGFLFLFDIDSAGTPSLLFPASFQESGRVGANRPLRFPRDGEIYNFSRPEGTDRLIAFLITDEQVADSLKVRLFGRSAPAPTGSRLTLVINDLQKIDLRSTTIWNKVICGFLTSEGPSNGSK